MDLLEELLELGSSLSVAKIKRMIDKTAYHVPGYFLSCLGMHDQLYAALESDDALDPITLNKPSIHYPETLPEP